MKARLLSLLLLGTPASADPVPHALQRHWRDAIPRQAVQSTSQPRPVPADAADKPWITTSSAREESPAHRANVDPVVASRLLGHRISADHPMSKRSVVERPSSWTDPVTRESSTWRPKIMVYPMKSMASGTGGKGVKLKFRF
jgi:hypothetical protein